MSIIDEIHGELGGDLENLDADYHDSEIARGVIVKMGGIRNDFLEIVQYDDRIIVEHHGHGATYFNADSAEFSSEVDEERETEYIEISDGDTMWRASRHTSYAQ